VFKLITLEKYNFKIIICDFYEQRHQYLACTYKIISHTCSNAVKQYMIADQWKHPELDIL